MNRTDSEVLKEVSLFVRAAVRIGCRYLSCGGPTSRLEQYILQAGQTLGFKSEVFSTPTGVFVSALNPKKNRVVTFVGRVKDTKFNLTELDDLETLLERLAKGEITPTEAIDIIKNQGDEFGGSSLLQKVIGSFFIGFCATLLQFGELLASGVAGILTTIVFFIVGPLTVRKQLNPMFTVFLGGFVGLLLSMALSVVLQLPIEALAVGSLIVLVPGLSLTTGISELAEQNYVSGLVKLLQSGISLVGLFVSFLLVNDLATLMNFSEFTISTPGIDIGNVFGPFGPYLIYGALVLSICLRFQVPPRSLFGVLVTAFSGWVFIHEFNNPEYTITLTFFASLLVGSLATAFGSVLKLPSQVFTVPGILSLVPGLFAVSSFGSLDDYSSSGLEVIIKTMLIASSIVFGLFVARVPFAGMGGREEVSSQMGDMEADEEDEDAIDADISVSAEISTKPNDIESLSNNPDYTKSLM